MDTTNGESHDLVIPYSILYQRLEDDVESEQHKSNREKNVHKRSIRHYRHATTKWGAALESFHPLWFAICISSGGLGSLLNGPFPYQGRWLVTLSTILYVVDLVTFLLFMGLMIARWIIYPHVAIRRAWASPDELGAYAIPPIALLTLSSLTATQVSEGSWGGHSFTLVSYVMWWTAVPWIFAMTLVLFTSLIYNGHQTDRAMTPVLFMAPVGMATAATEAGLITTYAHDMSARLAVPQMIVAYFALGIASFTALALYTIFFHKLLASGWPPAAKRPSLFILIGPCGQIATAFQTLGSSAANYMRFANYKPSAVHPPSSGTFWRQETADAIDGAGILLALLFQGFAYLWIGIAALGVLDIFLKRRASYGLVWWSLVFPSVVVATAWLELASSMDSPAFRALTCAMAILISIVYLLNWAFTIRGILTGKLIPMKTELEIEEELIKKAQDQTAAREKKEDA